MEREYSLDNSEDRAFVLGSLSIARLDIFSFPPDFLN